VGFLVVLGTSSPRRLELLSLFRIPFKVITPDVDECIENIYEPQSIVMELSRRKLEGVISQLSKNKFFESIDAIITADTIVWMNGEIFGKPKNEMEAKTMLRKLSGNWHKVFTGVCVKIEDDEILFFEETKVKFKELSEFEIDYYISTGEPLDKAGAYAIQGLGGVFVERIEGDYSNVIGLPISKLWQVLLDRGLFKNMRIENGPRERLLNEGAQSLTTEELIAILLRTGTRDRDVLTVSKELFEKHERSLYKMSKATIEDLRKFKGLGKVKAVTLLAALEIAKRLVKEEVKLTSPTLNSPEQVFQYCIDMQTFPQEVVRVLFLDSKLRLIGSSDISKGTLTTSIANPRDIFREALIRNAHGIIIVHNHPSGDPTPSEDDVEITKRLIEAGGVLNIKVLDHVVIGRTFCSIIQKFRNLL